MDLKQKQAALQKLLTAAKAIQDEWQNKEMPRNVGEDYEGKLQEAEALQAEVDRMVRLERMTKRHADVDALLLPQRTTLPPEVEPEPEPQPKPASKRIVGYAPLGEYITASDQFKRFHDNGMPLGQIAEVRVPSLLGLKIGGRYAPYVPLTAEQRKMYEAALEAKAVPTVGAGVVEADRAPGFVFDQTTEPDMLTLRDVFTVIPTTSDTVSWVEVTAFTRAAAPTAAGSAKPEGALTLANITATVETIAEWMPVNEQQLQDVIGLGQLIQTELLYNVRREEEEQIIYGSNASNELNGLCGSATAVPAESAGAQILDTIGGARRSVMIDGGMPNALLIHPTDWLAVQVLKGSDNHYLGQVFLTAPRALRVWGLQVVESVAMEDRTGEATEERNLVVGDFARGAQIYEKLGARIDIGWINAQFTANQRTIRAEERVTLAVKRPHFFRRYQTQAQVT